MPQEQKLQIPENRYIDVNYEYSVTTVDFYYLEEDLKDALREAEEIIRRSWPSVFDTKEIIEREVRQKLGEIVSLVKYSFDETVDWDVKVDNGVKVERVYDAVDVLEVCFRNGVTVEFTVHVDCVIIKEHIVYFKVNEIKLSRLWWRH